MHEVLNRFSPLVEMASIDEAYLDMTGTERLHGPPLRAAHALHETMKAETRLNCSIGIATARLVAKVASDQAKPNGVLWVVPGLRGRVSGAARRAQNPRRRQGHREESARAVDPQGRRPGAPGRRLPGRALRQMGAGPGRQSRAAWMRAAGSIPKSARMPTPSRSATSTPTTKTPADLAVLESTLARLSEMVGRRLRENGLHARTLQLKLRYSDFTTITRAHSIERPTQLDTEIFDEARALFLKNWKPGARVRLLGVQASSFEDVQDQLDLLDDGKHERWQQALAAADRLRDKYGDSAVSLAAGHEGRLPRTHA